MSPETDATDPNLTQAELDRLAAQAATVKVTFYADQPETPEHKEGREAFWGVIGQMAKTDGRS